MSVTIHHGDCRSILPTLPAGSVQCCVASLSEAQVAYLAGLVDGEGSLECQPQVSAKSRSPRFVLRLAFSFGTAEPITTVASWLGMVPTQYPAPSNRHSPRWRLSITKNIAVPLLRRVVPHLILKRRQAEIILRIEEIRASNSVPRSVPGPRSNLAMPQAAVDEMARLHADLRLLKSSKRRVK